MTTFYAVDGINWYHMYQLSADSTKLVHAPRVHRDDFSDFCNRNDTEVVFIGDIVKWHNNEKFATINGVEYPIDETR